jgi:A/G-specific adenine glycosylase
MKISHLLLNWYKKNKRNLPWRDTKDPYKIWLSEVILQQTRIDQGLSYYYKFRDQFPTVFLLADAPEDKIFKMWQGLGYYNRARNLHYTAKEIAHKRNGLFPDNFSDLKKLRGVGDYTAAAIASFAFKEPVAVVDGNVKRVIARVFQIEKIIETAPAKNMINEIAHQIISESHPDIHNQAIMELGSLVCKPANPDCNACPLNEKCLALKNNYVKRLPIKKKKLERKKRHIDYFLISNTKDVYIKKRSEKDIWSGLYDFPHLESPLKFPENPISANGKIHINDDQLNGSVIHTSKVYRHILSHQELLIRFIFIRSDLKDSVKNQQFIRVSLSNLEEYPVPRVIDRFLKEYSNLKKWFGNTSTI